MCRKGTRNPRIIYKNTKTNVVYRVSAGGFIDEGRHFTKDDQLKEIIAEIRKDPRTFKGPIKREYEHTIQEHSQILTLIPKEQEIHETPFYPEDNQILDTLEYLPDETLLSLDIQSVYSPNFSEYDANYPLDL